MLYVPDTAAMVRPRSATAARISSAVFGVISGGSDGPPMSAMLNWIASIP